MKHTPLPWTVWATDPRIVQHLEGDDQTPIAIVNSKPGIDDAHYIVKCVNLHDELVKALSDALHFLSYMANDESLLCMSGDNLKEWQEINPALFDILTRAKQ